jgi:hypothetical protein
MQEEMSAEGGGRFVRVQALCFQRNEPSADESGAVLGSLLREEMAAAREDDLLPAVEVGLKRGCRGGWDDDILVSPKEERGLLDRVGGEGCAEGCHVGFPGTEDLQDASESPAGAEDGEVRPELREGDGAGGAGSLVVGPEDQAAGSERDAESEEASPAGEVKGDDVGAVAREWMRGREENEALDVDGQGSTLRGGEPEGEGASVGVADDDGTLDAEGVGEGCDESGERLGAEVEMA